jgi:hypothetical protein
MPERTDTDDDRAENDRRRSPRFNCGGYAKISRLPSNGIFLAGSIRDLSLGGCHVDTTLPIDYGERAEIVVCVNATSFRAIGEVKAIRGRPGAGIEFVHLSAGGKGRLADLVAKLASLRVLMNKLKIRREIDQDSLRSQLENGKFQVAMLSERFPFHGTILHTGSSGESSGPEHATSPGEDLIKETPPLVIPIDLFG